MSLKDLFKQGGSKVLVATSTKELGEQAESEKHVYSKMQGANRLIPHVDFSNPANFAKFGSAEEYYVQSISRIYKTFPYDGSKYEVQAWYNSSSYLDLYIFDELYPRTNGYVIFSPDSTGSGWGTVSNTITMSGSTSASEGALQGGVYLKSSDLEYIFFKGGPHPDHDNSGINKAFPTITDNVSGSKGANVFDRSNNQESNLKLSGVDGNTVEFWLRKSELLNQMDLDVASNGFEVIFDCMTTGSWGGENSALSSSTNYGRFRIELSGGAATTTTSPFYITYMSGCNGLFRQQIGTINSSSVTNDVWQHYAFTIANTGAVGDVYTNSPPVNGGQSNHGSLKVDFYHNGRYINSVTTGSAVNHVSGAMVATVGSLVGSPSGSAGDTVFHNAVVEDVLSMRGYGKLSGSLDEFRFWKESRSAKQIGLNWKGAVGGGTNVDDANTQLGVYYKFNEGISQTSSVDATILDYSGRLSNGHWTGYSSGARQTGSAIVEASASSFEFKDPIVYSFHPDVRSLQDTKQMEGRVYDFQNAGSFYRTFPEWIISEDSETEKNLLKLTQIMASYFDTLALQLKQLPQIKDKGYVSSSAGSTQNYKPLPFMDRVLETQGFVTPEIFANSTILERFMDKDDHKKFTENLTDVKNLIYQNVYNNLIEIYKSKGTSKAFRNLVRCFGVGEELIQLNMYADNAIYDLKPNYSYRTERKNYIDFNTYGDYAAVVYQFASASNPNSTGFISASQGASGSKTDPFLEAGMAQTYECEFIAPPPGDPRVQQATFYPHLSSSIFGVEQANIGANGVVDSPDPHVQLVPARNYANFQVYLARDKVRSKDARFVLTGSGASGIPLLQSDLIPDVYDDKKWNIAVRIVPKRHPWANTVQETTGSLDNKKTSDQNGYDVQFYGVNYDANTIRTSFYVTSSFISSSVNSEALVRGDGFLKNPKRMYLGARRTALTGTVLTKTDIKGGPVRAWMSYISNEEINHHAMDPFNYGVESPYKSAYLLEGSSSKNSSSPYPESQVHQGDLPRVPKIKTLALNWDYSLMTGSSTAGMFSVSDLSSGSVEDSKSYKWLGDIVGLQHPGKGQFFSTSSAKVVDTNFINAAKQKPPEVVNGLDMIQSLSRDDQQFTRESRPAEYYYVLEKSMYNVVSEQILEYFSTIKDFNNLIGEPVNKYRMEYKAMDKLRQLFFENVENTPDIEKYVEYYRWLDDSIGAMAEQLYPASAAHAKGLKTLVESHVLERNKYWHKYPTFDNGAPLRNLGPKPYQEDYPINAISTEWIENSPVKTSPLDTNISFNWWNYAAERDKTSEISSGDSTVDKVREQLRKIISNPRTYGLGVGLYRRSTRINVNDIYNPPTTKALVYPDRLFHDFTSGPNDLRESGASVLKSDVNFQKGTAPDLRVDQNPQEIIEIRGGNANYYLTESSVRFPKIKVIPKATLMDSNEGFEEDNKIKKWPGLPTIFSSSTGMYFANVQQHVTHRTEVALQGPFVEHHVGGYKNLKFPIHTASQTGSTIFDHSQRQHSMENRPERFRISKPIKLLSSRDINIYQPIKNLSGTEDLTLARTDINAGPKRVYNIKNIKQLTGSAIKSSTILGNFDENYQVVQTSGRSINNLWFVFNSDQITSATPELAFFRGINSTFQLSGSTVLDSLGNLDYEIPTRNTHKSVFVNRFAAPGGFEISSQGYMDPQAEEKSVYNALPFRNRTVLDGSGSVSGLTPPSDYTSPKTHLGIYTRIHPSWGSGLNELSRRHSGKFGIDSVFGTIRADDYDTTASYQKIQRNTRRIIKYSDAVNDVLPSYNAARYVTASVYNNLFVNSPIPQSETQYMWISHSLKNPADHRLVGYTSNQRGYDGQISGANGFQDAINFNKGEFPKYSGYFADFAGMNTLVVENLNTGSNLLSVDSDYRNTLFATVTAGQSFQALMKHRNGRNGASWRMQFKNDNPLVRNQRKNNVIDTLVRRQIGQLGTNDTTYYQNTANFSKDLFVYDIKKYTIPPVTTKFKPLIHDLEQAGKDVVLKDTYSNNFDFTSNANLDLILGVKQDKKQIHDIIINDVVDGKNIKLDRLIYSEVVYPKEVNTYLAKVRGRVAYAEDSGSANLNRRWGTQRTYWRNLRDDRARSLGQANNSADISQYGPIGTCSAGVGRTLGFFDPFLAAEPGLSVWPLDGVFFSGNVGTSFGGSVSGRGPTRTSNEALAVNGELINPVAPYIFGSVNGSALVSGDTDIYYAPITASQQFLYFNLVLPYSYNAAAPGIARPTRADRFINYNFYKTNVLAGKNPWYDSYADYAQDIRVMAQDHTVVPEFRISEHMEHYVDNAFSFNNQFLTVEGANVSASANSPTDAYNDDFFKIYSHSDFMNHFAKFDNSDTKLKNLSLTCRGIKKLLPYNGFYPVLRTTQLGALLSSSLGPHISGSHSTENSVASSKTGVGGTGSAPIEQLMALWQPFFAPGIMYNTIKSGLAVDYPVITGSVATTTSTFVQQLSYLRGEANFKPVYNYRMPFEALVDPQRYIPVSSSSGDKKVQYIQHQTRSLDKLGMFFDWTGNSDFRYNLAINNFLAAVPDFFLETGKFTTFSSKTENNFKPMKSGSTYYMDVLLHQSDQMVTSEGPRDINVKFFRDTTTTPDQVGSGSMNMRGSIYGPPLQVFAKDSRIIDSGSNTNYYDEVTNLYDPAYAAHTPPYFYGPSIARVSFSPHEHVALLEDESKFFTLDEILAGCRIETTYTGSMTEQNNLLLSSSQNGYAAGRHHMRLSSSINLFGKSRLKKIQFSAGESDQGEFVAETAVEANDSSLDVWTISTKFECPNVNVSSSNVENLAEIATRFTRLGAYSNEYNVQDIDDYYQSLLHSTGTKSIWGSYGFPATGSEGVFLSIKESFPEVILNPDTTASETTGSLIDVCGFEQTERRIGEIAAEREISEAIMAIPFVLKNGKRRFFKVLKTQVKYALGTATQGQITQLQNNGKLPGDSIVNMVNTLKNYVLPPHLDFLNNKTVNPYVAYVFEFTHKLDRDDLSDIWQNLMPKIAMSPESQEVTISHSMDKNEFFGGQQIPPQTQWMVFKVKRRAPYNYFATTADSTDDDRFAFQFEVGGEKKVPTYSYNWPYDYFSLVELAQIEAEAEFKVNIPPPLAASSETPVAPPTTGATTVTPVPPANTPPVSPPGSPGGSGGSGDY